MVNHIIIITFTTDRLSDIGTVLKLQLAFSSFSLIIYLSGVCSFCLLIVGDGVCFDPSSFVFRHRPKHFYLYNKHPSGGAVGSSMCPRQAGCRWRASVLSNLDGTIRNILYHT